MAKKPKSILGWLTGIQAFGFGANWTPLEDEVARLKKLNVFFADRGVLYEDYDLEVEEHVLLSVEAIRGRLVEELEVLDDQSESVKSLGALARACQAFMRNPGVNSGAPLRREDLLINLGKLRGIFGIHLSCLAELYGLELDDRLVEGTMMLDEDKTDDAI